MDNLNIPETPDTPIINFDASTGLLEVTGKSLPEDVREFYSPVLAWLNEYCANPKETTLLKMRMDYFNTASSKMLLELLELLNKLHQNGGNVRVEWSYHEDDEDMEEAGADYSDMLDLPFELISFR